MRVREVVPHTKAGTSLPIEVSEGLEGKEDYKSYFS